MDPIAFLLEVSKLFDSVKAHHARLGLGPRSHKPVQLPREIDEIVEGDGEETDRLVISQCYRQNSEEDDNRGGHHVEHEVEPLLSRETEEEGLLTGVDYAIYLCCKR